MWRALLFLLALISCCRGGGDDIKKKDVGGGSGGGPGGGGGGSDQLALESGGHLERGGGHLGGGGHHGGGGGHHGGGGGGGHLGGGGGGGHLGGSGGGGHLGGGGGGHLGGGGGGGHLGGGGPPPGSPHAGDLWPVPAPQLPSIASLDVKCGRNSMKVFISFDKPFYGLVFSKGHYSNGNCVHLPPGLGRLQASFEIGVHSCGTAGNTENGLYGYGAESGSGTYFENVIVVQYDPQVQEVWDQARKLRCTWHDQYEKSVTFRPFPVDMLDVVRADFAGDNVGCWMQIQVGKGPWASEVSGLVKIGQTMSMVLAIKDEESKFDMLVRNCVAHDGKRAPIQLVDRRGCVVRPKLMSRFTKIKNFGASASVLSYAHFQAFKFPDSMEVHFQCTIQICRYQCPEQCAPEEEHHGGLGNGLGGVADERSRSRRSLPAASSEEVGLNRVIRVVSGGDLTFPLSSSAEENGTSSTAPTTLVFPQREGGTVCLRTPGLLAGLGLLLAVLLGSSLLSASLCIRLRNKT